MSIYGVAFIRDLRLDLSLSEKMFLMILATRSNKDHECWPSLKSIAEDGGFDIKTVKKCKGILIKKGLISLTGKKKGRTGQVDVIRLTCLENAQNVEDERDPLFPVKGTQFFHSKGPTFGPRNYKGELEKGRGNFTPPISSIKKQKTGLVYEEKDLIEIFQMKFSGYDLTIEQLYASFANYYDVTDYSYNRLKIKFRNWIKSEDLRKYRKRSLVNNDYVISDRELLQSHQWNKRHPFLPPIVFNAYEQERLNDLLNN